MNNVFVIAHYKENLHWIPENSVVITKDVHIPNTGREASSYLHYIVENYDTLPQKITFLQGNPFEHCNDIYKNTGDFTSLGDIYQCDREGNPHHPQLRLQECADLLGIEIPEKLDFIVGAQFSVTRKIIKKRPKTFYENALVVANTFSQGAWCFERLWKYIFI